MKRIPFLTILLLISFGIAGSYGQNVIMVGAGSNQISAAFAQAGPGDVIELVTSGGTYYEDSTLTAKFPIIIRAAAGLQNKPIWESGDDHVLDIGSSVWLSGIKMSGFVDDGFEDDRDSTKYAMRSADVVDLGYTLICEDMEFDHFGRIDDGEYQGYVYRADAEADYAAEIRFTNCIFTRIPKYAFRFREPISAPGQFGLLSVENCTFAGIGSYGMRAELLSDPGVTDAQIRVNHCTFYDIGNDMIRADDDGANSFTDIVVKNSIIYETGQIVDASHGTVTYCDTLNTGGFNIDDENAIIENIFDKDPDFADPDNFNFTVRDLFFKTVIGDDDLCVGDARWWPSVVCIGLRGDPTGDGTINILDVLSIANHILGLSELTGDALCRGDCTGDEVINILDALSIANVILNIIPECPRSGACKPVVTAEILELMKSLEPLMPAAEYTRFIALVKGEAGIPAEYALAQNYPNPFNPLTWIVYSLPENTRVRLSVYNVLGQEVQVLVDGQVEAGSHTVHWNGRDASSGVYFYQLQAGDFKTTKCMVLMK